MNRVLLVALFVVGIVLPAAGVEPTEVLADPALEARAREISQGLRCVVCQNQSIDDSKAEIAHDMRVLVRERLQAGDSDEEVIQFLVDRYGEYVRLRPSLRPETYPLWFGPPVMVIVVVLAFLMAYRAKQSRTSSEGVRPLTEAERARLDTLVEALDDGRGPTSREPAGRRSA